jgi:Caulimovirus viroplasmin
MVSTSVQISFSLLQCLIIESRNFAATQTKGVSSAIYEKFASKAEAEAAYRQAVQNGFVQVLQL